MRIVNPTFGPTHQPDAPGIVPDAPLDWRRDPIAIISNAKPNARELLEGLRQQMSSVRDTGNIDYLYKDSAAQPAPVELLDHVAANYKGAILALAD
ncbi:MAG: hypothetical protein AAF458_03720 [Pseudomonadota bacterium]